MTPPGTGDAMSPRAGQVDEMATFAADLVRLKQADLGQIRSRFVEAGLADEELSHAMRRVDQQLAGAQSAKRKHRTEIVLGLIGGVVMVGLVLLAMWFVEFR